MVRKIQWRSGSGLQEGKEEDEKDTKAKRASTIMTTHTSLVIMKSMKGPDFCGESVRVDKDNSVVSRTRRSVLEDDHRKDKRRKSQVARADRGGSRV